MGEKETESLREREVSWGNGSAQKNVYCSSMWMEVQVPRTHEERQMGPCTPVASAPWLVGKRLEGHWGLLAPSIAKNTVNSSFLPQGNKVESNRAGLILWPPYIM